MIAITRLLLDRPCLMYIICAVCEDLLTHKVIMWSSWCVFLVSWQLISKLYHRSNLSSPMKEDTSNSIIALATALPFPRQLLIWSLFTWRKPLSMESEIFLETSLLWRTRGFLQWTDYGNFHSWLRLASGIDSYRMRSVPEFCFLDTSSSTFCKAR